MRAAGSAAEAETVETVVIAGETEKKPFPVSPDFSDLDAAARAVSERAAEDSDGDKKSKETSNDKPSGGSEERSDVPDDVRLSESVSLSAIGKEVEIGAGPRQLCTTIALSASEVRGGEAVEFSDDAFREEGKKTMKGNESGGSPSQQNLPAGADLASTNHTGKQAAGFIAEAETVVIAQEHEAPDIQRAHPTLDHLTPAQRKLLGKKVIRDLEAETKLRSDGAMHDVEMTPSVLKMEAKSAEENSEPPTAKLDESAAELPTSKNSPEPFKVARTVDPTMKHLSPAQLKLFGKSGGAKKLSSN